MQDEVSAATAILGLDGFVLLAVSRLIWSSRARTGFPSVPTDRLREVTLDPAKDYQPRRRSHASEVPRRALSI